MKKRTFSIFCLTVICAIFSACPNYPSVETCKVSFYDGEEFLKTVEVLKGSFVNDVFVLGDDTRHFAGWTTGGSAYNFEIIEDSVFYAKWQVIANIYDYDHKTLISTEYFDFGENIETQNNITLNEIKNRNIQEGDELFGFRYFSYSPDATENDYETKRLTVLEHSPINIYPVKTKKIYPKNFNVTVSDSRIDVSWTFTEQFNYIILTDSEGKNLYSRAQPRPSDSDTGNVSFYHLKNGEQYTIQFGGTNTLFSVQATPKIIKKEVDWVVAFYMAADNDLNNCLWLDCNEIEQGLSEIRDSHNIPLPEYDNVEAVVLWDGWSKSAGNIYGTKNTVLYEMGIDSSDKIKEKWDEYITRPLNFGSYTKNLSYTADWLTKNKNFGTDPNDYYGELNLGSKNTLVKYLNWVNEHYTAKKGIILQFSDHGGGPRSVSLSNTGRKAMCWDESHNDDFLKTGDVSTALREAGYGKNNKLAMIVTDVCLGASVEDAYEFSPYAEYLIASPNSISGYGLNYIAFMRSFEKNTTIEKIGETAVKDFNDFYYYDYVNNFYNHLDYLIENNEALSAMTDDERYDYMYNLENKEAEDIGVSTLSCINLSQVKTLAEKISNLSTFLLENADYNVNINTKAGSEEIKYSSYVGKLCLNVLETPDYDYIDYYKGTFTWLCDIGTFASGIVKLATSDGIEWPELEQKAQEVLDAMDNAIVAAWRDSIFDENYYTKFDDREGYKHPCGLTISSYCLSNDVEGKLLAGPAPYYFYPTDLQFGKDTSWYNLLKWLFGVPEGK